MPDIENTGKEIRDTEKKEVIIVDELPGIPCYHEYPEGYDDRKELDKALE